MNTANIKRWNLGARRKRKHPLAFTALLYLRDALLAEAYEDCAHFIRVALEFGATTSEIRLILEDARRYPHP